MCGKGRDRRLGRSGDGPGIGEATLRGFVYESASVAFCDRDGERVAAELEIVGAAQKFGRLDIFINDTASANARRSAGRAGTRACRQLSQQSTATN